MSVLTLQNISKTYDKPALSDVSLTVNRGEILGLLGESGSGKSTILRIAAGFIDADSGQVLFKNKPIVKAADQLIAGHADIKIVHQAYELFPNISVKENIVYALRFYEKDFQESRANELLELCNLAPLANRNIKTLSGGERQRTAIARALAEKAKVLLLDEPFAHLDLANRNKIVEVVRRLVSQMGVACIFVTHDTQSALSLSTRLGVLHQGQLIQVDTPQRVYQYPANAYVAQLTGDVNFLKINFLKEHLALFGICNSEPNMDGFKIQKRLANLCHILPEKLAAIRPEAFYVVDLASEYIMLGTVKQCVFCGHYYKIQALVAKQKIWLLTSQPFEVNSLINIGLRG